MPSWLQILIAAAVWLIGGRIVRAVSGFEGPKDMNKLAYWVWDVPSFIAGVLIGAL